MRQRLAVGVIALAVAAAGCRTGLDPAASLQRDPLEINELRGAESVVIVPVQGDCCVWARRGRIKAEGAVAAGTVAAGIGAGAVLATGFIVTPTGIVLMMTPAAGVATAGLAVAAAGAVLAIDAAAREAYDQRLERALEDALKSRPEQALADGMAGQLKARFGVRLLNIDTLDADTKCDVVILVRTWKHGAFRVYTDRRTKDSLRPFQYVTMHVYRTTRLSPRLIAGLRDLARAGPQAGCGVDAQNILEDEQVWFGNRVGKPVACWSRFLIGRTPVPSSREALVESAPKIRRELEDMARSLGDRYGLHTALAIR